MQSSYNEIAGPANSASGARVDDGGCRVSADDLELGFGVFGFENLLCEVSLLLLRVAWLDTHIVVNLAKDFCFLCTWLEMDMVRDGSLHGRATDLVSPCGSMAGSGFCDRTSSSVVERQLVIWRDGECAIRMSCECSEKSDQGGAVA